eukprot:scaffold57674_cov35-Prasinocladus_malaysianus.AAC.1
MFSVARAVSRTATAWKHSINLAGEVTVYSAMVRCDLAVVRRNVRWRGGIIYGVEGDSPEIL